MNFSAQERKQSDRRIPLSERRWEIGPLVYSFSGLVVLFGWLLFGDFAWNARERAITPLVQLMLEGEGVSDTIVGLLVGSLPAALGMFIAPAVGYRSDRFRSRLGRRIPFLLVSTPVASAAMLGLAFAPAVGGWLHKTLGGNSPGLALCFLAFFTVCWISFEVAAVVGNTLFLALINDVVPRVMLGRFFGLFRVVSIVVGILFNFFLMGKAEEHLCEILIGLAVIYGAGFTLMCLRVKEGEYPPVSETEIREGFSVSVRRYFRECFTHRYYLWLFGALALANMAFTPVNIFSIFYAKSVDMGMGAYGKILAGGFVVSLLTSYPIGSLADRFHPLRIALAALLVYFPLCIWAVIWARTSGTFAFGFAIHVIISGIFFTGTASLGQRLFPKERFAQFASAGQMILGLLTMLLPPMTGLILDMSGHAYQLTFLVGAILCLLAVASFLVVMKYFHRLGGDAAYHPPNT